MPRSPKSQWDFGELFPTEATRKVLSVSELTTQVKRLLEKQVGQIWVTGEITNLRAQSSGHVYFTLKDASSQLSCVLFRGEATTARVWLEDGRKVILNGEVTVYEPRGQYQLIVHEVELHGVGALQIAFEKLKQKLNAEGLFAPERKRPLPLFPQRIGLVTSLTGAAIRDVLHVIQRRQPGLEIILAPCRVQGAGAAAEIASGIRLLNECAARGGALDLILVTRGGGSLEDLWAFNEEVVARAIFESIVPVVSAIGHEIDFTISDFVADLRAATPSAAAELITEGAFSSRQFVAEAAARLAQLARARVAAELETLADCRQRLGRVHPQRWVQEKMQRLDDLQTSLLRTARFRLRERQNAWHGFRQRLARVQPAQTLLRQREIVLRLTGRLIELGRHSLAREKNHLTNTQARLRLLSLESTLSRGYSITTDAASGEIIRAASEVRAGQRLKTRLHAGEVQSVVERPRSDA
ncbi:MAG: exodeoxyribonuclease VII large subunit [Verrucomicrobia bacterium]|nr:exodeoxyribonuclease VII large subunit [Verrucomicrobiota bacterium]